MTVSLVPLLLEETASNFWGPLLAYKVFPIDIDRVVAFSDLPIIIVQLSNLTIRGIQLWIVQNNYPVTFSAEDRLLHGFLLAYEGRGVIFVNGTDPPEERRYTVAHEVAHFLLDHQIPRQRMIRAFGQSIIEVLDGKRPPSLSERIQFVTTDLPSLFSAHHLDNSSLTAYDRHLVWQAEQRVDALATEILAPHKEVVRRLHLEDGAQWGPCLAPIRKLLSETFGLPQLVSQSYAKHIDKHITGGNGLAKEWGMN
ncbi:ImmA/IrrE family metallo-endopeptidase [Fibrella sp. HMF5335]|uniref:ImmA/IrrE family metallo-endopeptidase n=1 Tax=Fibrella rubiginis TaxID=2817060 RepID=A0A939K5F4_9BACT|nr:ImmA/IrrE family metallo-endopeptidase [Fibrella rubiginis]MBO0939429.1 ImmA/IrrE family metallo-endopeptidase [Fibrella rubiginis]